MRGCIRKRGKSWAVIVYLGRDGQGKRRYKWYTHSTRREAEAHLGQLLAQAQSGWVPSPARLRVGEYLERWLRDYAASNVEQTTLQTYAGVIRKHVVPDLGQVPLARLTPQAVQSALSARLAAGAAPATVHKAYRVLREALGHAVEWGLLSRNIAEAVRPPRARLREMRVWDEEQVRLFLAEARRASRFYELYLGALLTGMRQAELLGLRWQDIEWATGTAFVRQTLVRVGSQVVFKRPKTTHSRRAVALPAALLDALRDLRDRQEEQQRLVGPLWCAHDLVWCQTDGKPLWAANLVKRDFYRLCERAGVPRVRFHDLRHCHASHLLLAGVHPKVVSERLGHAHPAFTMHVYSHVLPGLQEEAARRLADRLLGRD